MTDNADALSFFCGQVDEEDYPQDVFRLHREVQESDGVILGTPEYHGSLSGTLKNMLDLMSQAELEGKIVGLIGVAGGHTGAINSLNTMRTIGRNMHFWVLPQEVSVADSHSTFNDDETVTDPAIEERLLNIGRQLVKLASVQKKVRDNGEVAIYTPKSQAAHIIRRVMIRMTAIMSYVNPV